MKSVYTGDTTLGAYKKVYQVEAENLAIAQTSPQSLHSPLKFP